MCSKKSDNDSANDNGHLDESFSDMIEGVTPLSQNKIDPDAAPRPKHMVKPRDEQQAPDTRLTKSQTLGELEYITPVTPDEVLSFVRGGIQAKLQSKLKKGLIPFEYKIDLHGATVNQAGKQLQHAIESTYASGLRCVLVVHGRGKGSLNNKPALKTHVNQWLRDLPQVLAFHSAQPRHGGTGALYVLLKKQR